MKHKDRGPRSTWVKITDSIKSNFAWFYARRRRPDRLLRQAWFKASITSLSPVTIRPGLTRGLARLGLQNRPSMRSGETGRSIEGQHLEPTTFNGLTKCDDEDRRGCSMRPLPRNFATMRRPGGVEHGLYGPQRDGHSPSAPGCNRSVMPTARPRAITICNYQLCERRHVGPALGELPARGCAEQSGVHHVQIELAWRT